MSRYGRKTSQCAVMAHDQLFLLLEILFSKPRQTSAQLNLTVDEDAGSASGDNGHNDNGGGYDKANAQPNQTENADEQENATDRHLVNPFLPLRGCIGYINGFWFAFLRSKPGCCN